MEDFIKQFKGNLENRPEPEFEDRLWRKLGKSLEEQDKKPLGGFAWWWPTAALFLLLGSNLLFFLEMKKANEKIAKLEIKKDTILQTQTIYKRDTIIQTKTIREKVIEYVPAFLSKSALVFDELPGFKLESSFSRNGNFQGFSTSTPSAIARYWQQIHIEKAQPSEVEMAEASLLNGPLETLESVALQPFSYFSELPLLEAEPLVKKQKKTFRHYLYAMRPKGFRLGLIGGLALPFNEDLNNRSGYSAGIEAVLEFSPSLQMWADASYLKIQLQTNRMDETIGVPQVEPPSDDFTFVSAELKQPSLQYAVGMQYLFNSDGKWKPLIGLGFGAVSLFPYQVVYDFQNEPLDIELSIDKTINRRELITNYLLLRAGLEHEFSKRWFWQIRVGYRTNLDNTGFQSTKLINVQSGLSYHF